MIGANHVNDSLYLLHRTALLEPEVIGANHVNDSLYLLHRTDLEPEQRVQRALVLPEPAERRDQQVLTTHGRTRVELTAVFTAAAGILHRDWSCGPRRHLQPGRDELVLADELQEAESPPTIRGHQGPFLLEGSVHVCCMDCDALTPGCSGWRAGSARRRRRPLKGHTTRGD